LPIIPAGEKPYSISEPRSIAYQQCVFIPAETQCFAHSQENNTSTSKQEKTVRKNPKNKSISLNAPQTLLIFHNFFPCQNTATEMACVAERSPFQESTGVGILPSYVESILITLFGTMGNYWVKCCTFTGIKRRFWDGILWGGHSKHDTSPSSQAKVVNRYP